MSSCEDVPPQGGQLIYVLPENTKLKHVWFAHSNKPDQWNLWTTLTLSVDASAWPPLTEVWWYGIWHTNELL